MTATLASPKFELTVTEIVEASQARFKVCHRAAQGRACGLPDENS